MKFLALFFNESNSVGSVTHGKNTVQYIYVYST